MAPFERLKILLLISLRSVAAHRVKSAVVGGIMFFGTFLLVVGGSLLDSVEDSMSRSVTASMAGNLQVYSSKAEDKLALFGGFGAPGAEDIGEIEEFAKVRASLLAVPNVKAVVPMGVTVSTVFGQNEIDMVLGSLRDGVNRGDAATVAGDVARVRRICQALAADYDLVAELAEDKEKVKRDKANLVTATSDAFWAEFAVDPIPQLDFLDSAVAPLAADGRFAFLRMIGTDPQLFAQSFDRFYVVRGEMIPDGKRGVMLAERFYDETLKNKVARDIDTVKQSLDDGETIAGSTVLKEKVDRIVRQYQRITFQLSPEDAKLVEAKLRELLPSEKGDFGALVQAFLRFDDANFAARYAFFYREIGPRIRLYEVAVGDTMTLRAFTKSGYVKSVNVKVWGTYSFKGLETSSIAGFNNITDLVTWRDLYGKMSVEQKAELEAIKQAVGAAAAVDVTGADLEAQLFGEASAAPPADAPAPAPETAAAADPAAAPAAESPRFNEFEGVTIQTRAERAAALADNAYERAEMESGLALNAAILLNDPDKASATQAAVAEKLKADGLDIQVVDWLAASGLVGQFIYVFRGILYGAIGLLFFVALVIINNAMVMATVERTPEIGTMRAIGAQRTFVMAMLLVETLVLGLLAGVIGSLAGWAFISVLGQVGIGSKTPEIIVLFGGPRLYPFFSPGKAVLGMVTITVVSAFSTLYPAVLAALVPPITAMQGKE
jgi:ABC-type lipoprotein release transport system permease subunit